MSTEEPVSLENHALEEMPTEQAMSVDSARGQDTQPESDMDNITESDIDDISTSSLAEPPVHALDLHGSGHFSTGSCTGCAWSSKGHADDVRRRWEEYHPDSGARVIELPQRVVVPLPHERKDIQLLERRIIVLLTYHLDFERPGALMVAAGVAQARAILLTLVGPDAHGDNDAREYVSVLMARIAHLSKRQREKLRHPSRNREEQQRILDGETL